MTPAQPAIISWIPADQGGRQHAPAGPTYTTVARFEEDENWPQDAWTLVVKLLRPLGDGRYSLAEIAFLADQGPAALLHRGSRFVLLEGPRRVAKGVVLAPSTPVPEEMTEFESSLIG